MSVYFPKPTQPTKTALSSAKAQNTLAPKTPATQVTPPAAQVTPQRRAALFTEDRFETQGGSPLRPGTRPTTGSLNPNTNWEQFNARSPSGTPIRPGTSLNTGSPIPATNWDRALDKTPQPPSTFDHRDREPTASDGHLVGANGRAYPPGTSPDQVDAVEPSNGPGDETVIFVNGQGTSPSSFGENLQDLADATSANVVGVYNATQGTFQDTLQSLKDKTDVGNNPAVGTTADLVYEKITQGEDVRLVGHSQGALILSRALEDVKQRLLSEGRSEDEVKELLGQVSVETLGGAATSYPDGPNYTHYINQADFVPRELGLGETDSPLFDLTPNVVGVHTHPGEGAKVIEFEDGTQEERNNPGGRDHALTTYLEHYARPEDVDSHPDLVEELPTPGSHFLDQLIDLHNPVEVASEAIETTTDVISAVGDGLEAAGDFLFG